MNRTTGPSIGLAAVPAAALGVALSAGIAFAGNSGSATIGPRANVYRAGGNPGTDAGENPAFVGIPPTAVSISFVEIEGDIRYGPGIPVNGPDGIETACDTQPDVGGIAGADEVFRARALLGVFLDDATPAAPPPASLVYGGDVASASYAPGIGQVFFVGDGRVGIDDPNAERQVFEVPAGATRLFLGLYDGVGCGSQPSSYADNTGGFTAFYEIEAVPCNAADLAEPLGVLDLADVGAFVSAFGGGEPIADFADPAGVFDLADIVAFIELFTAGCP